MTLKKQKLSKQNKRGEVYPMESGTQERKRVKYNTPLQTVNTDIRNEYQSRRSIEKWPPKTPGCNSTPPCLKKHRITALSTQWQISGRSLRATEIGDLSTQDPLGVTIIGARRGSEIRDLSAQDPLGVTTIGARRGTELRESSAQDPLGVIITWCQEGHSDQHQEHGRIYRLKSAHLKIKRTLEIFNSCA